MQKHVHEYLDGDRPLDSLTREEREELTQFTAAIAAATEGVRSHPVPDLSARVMAMAPATPEPLPPSRTRAFLDLLWSPVHVELQLRPAFGIGFAIAALVLAVALPLGLRSAIPDPATPDAAIFVQFRFEAPAASRVALAGSFTGWEPRVELRQTAPGVWSAMVPLAPGVHDYTFVVDGTEWVPDPHAFGIDDSFGGTNSRITLLPPSSDT
jgi:hypothetical protein